MSKRMGVREVCDWMESESAFEFAMVLSKQRLG